MEILLEVFKKKSTSIFDLFFMAYFNIESVLVSAKSE